LIGCGRAPGKTGQGSDFSTESKEAGPKTEVEDQPQSINLRTVQNSMIRQGYDFERQALFVKYL
jgi:hypothetical protein